ncbi:P97 family adhesin [Mesomycoplasma flocculare]|uniref:p97/LppS family protein n=1 Tax=Mesomycoplasma flocculare ATCC 27399 TaxID=743971 RepID=A0A0A8E6U6_MESFC|nr:hypothetical protein [Mesomycoplasma flocculare]AJC49674.1 P97/LppS family protein [Mesomycoplasma flocculare ATCC 27399]ENX51062.1 outer membrane protein - P95 [Mesomycoplasma flocculare ATCC 27716]
MKIVKQIKKTKYLSTKSKILLGLGLSSAFLAVLGISVAASYGFALSKKKSYEITVEDLNRLATKINGLSFNSQKISPFSNYATLKKEWKNMQNSEKNGDFFDFYTLEYKRLQPYKLPNGIWVEFIKIEPDDANQQFSVEFVLKTFNGSRIIKSDIKTDKVTISPNSTFFLENFYQALQINLKNISPYSRVQKGKKSPKNWLASDFLNEINIEETADGAIQKIRDFFNFNFDSVLKNKNFSIKYNNALIFPYKIEILKNSMNTWLKPSQTNADFLEIQGKVSFTDQAKKLFPKNFNTNITKYFNFLLFDSTKNESAFADPNFFIKIPEIAEPKIDEFASKNSQEKFNSQQKSILSVYKFIKYKENNSGLKSAEEAKKALNSLFINGLELDFGKYNDLDAKIKKKFEYKILVDKIHFGSDENSAFIRVPFEISYPLDEKKEKKLKTETQVLLRNFKNSASQSVLTFNPKEFASIPVVSLKYPNNQSQNNDGLYESFEPVSKSQIERLLALNYHEKIYEILTDSSKFNLTFSEKEVLNSWILSYKFPTIAEFSKRTLIPENRKNNTQIIPFFQNNQEFIAFTNKILTLPKEEAKKYLEIFLNALTQEKQAQIKGTFNREQKPLESSDNDKAALLKVQEVQSQENKDNLQKSQQTKTGKQETFNAKSPDSSTSNTQQVNSEQQKKFGKTLNGNTKTSATEFNNKIVAKLQKQYKISILKDLIYKIDALESESGGQSKLNLDSFTDLFINTYKNNDLIIQFNTFAENLNYNIVFVPNQDSESISDEEKINLVNKSDSTIENLKKSEKNQSSTEPSTQKNVLKNKVSLFQEAKPSSQNGTPQKSSAEFTTISRHERETEVFKLGYYYIFTSSNTNKIVFRTPIKSIKLKVFSAEKAGDDLEKLSYNILNFPQSLLKLELAENNFASADALKKSAEEILKAEFNSQDKDLKSTTESFRKLFGNKTFMKVYPLLYGNGLIYKKDSVFKDKFGNLRIRFAVKDLDVSEQRQIILPSILDPEKSEELSKNTEKVKEKLQNSLTQPATSDSQQTQSSLQNDLNNLKTELGVFKPDEKEAKYPLVFIVIKPDKQFKRN